MIRSSCEEVTVETFVLARSLKNCVDECRKDALKGGVDPSVAWEIFVKCVKECKEDYARP